METHYRWQRSIELYWQTCCCEHEYVGFFSLAFHWWWLLLPLLPIYWMSVSAGNHSSVRKIFERGGSDQKFSMFFSGVSIAVDTISLMSADKNDAHKISLLPLMHQTDWRCGGNETGNDRSSSSLRCSFVPFQLSWQMMNDSKWKIPTHQYTISPSPAAAINCAAHEWEKLAPRPDFVNTRHTGSVVPLVIDIGLFIVSIFWELPRHTILGFCAVCVDGIPLHGLSCSRAFTSLYVCEYVLSLNYKMNRPIYTFIAEWMGDTYLARSTNYAALEMTTKSIQASSNIEWGCAAERIWWLFVECEIKNAK